MAKLIVGFSYAPGKCFSKLIQVCTKSQSSHTYIVLEAAGQIIVYQASGLCVNFHSKAAFLSLEIPTELYEFEITDEKDDENRQHRLTTIGNPYAWKEVLGYPWIWANEAMGRTVKNPFSDGVHASVCVDEAAWHLPINPELAAGSMTPEDLRRYCAKYGKKVMISPFG